VSLLRIDLTKRDIHQIHSELPDVKQILISQIMGDVPLHHNWNFVNTTVFPQD
jgi:hypothetical protein